MDPDETLRELRQAAEGLEQVINSERATSVHLWAEIVLQRFTALDEWLSKGGFPPQAWHREEAP